VKLRRIAEKFRQAANAGGELRNLDLEEAAGGLIIRAWELRCLDGIEGLAHLVAWVKDPDPANNESIMVPCPASLFIEFCGFHGHVVRQVGDALEIIPGEHIGLLPRLLPKTLPDLPAQDSPSKWNGLFQHYSEVCEWLANQVGETHISEPQTISVAKTDPVTAACDAWLVKQWGIGKTLQQILNGFRTKPQTWSAPESESGLRHRLDAAYVRATGKNRPRRPQGRRSTRPK
jgi:hypothetical protein